MSLGSQPIFFTLEAQTQLIQDELILVQAEIGYKRSITAARPRNCQPPGSPSGSNRRSGEVRRYEQSAVSPQRSAIKHSAVGLHEARGLPKTCHQWFHRHYLDREGRA